MYHAVQVVPRPFGGTRIVVANYALDRLRFRGVRVIVANTGADITDRTGRLVASVMGWKDEAFLADLADKTRRGMRGQIERGMTVGGRAYGYCTESVTDSSGTEIGRRRVINPAEAEVVRNIYRLYANGLTPRAIAHRLNAEHVAPPRGPRNRVTGSWTPATIIGPANRTLGVLRNPMYHGKVAWNRSRKIYDPDTGRRIMRVRPAAEWVWTDVPELRIVPEDVWLRVQTRLQQRAWVPGCREGARPKHLLSGLMVCGSCSAHYTIQTHRRGDGGYYGCAGHADRGVAVCANGRLVRREIVEHRILDHIFGGLFTPGRIAYLERAVAAALDRTRAQATDTAAQREGALRDARHELNNIAAAIRSGIFTPTTKSMLEDAERRVAALEQAVVDARRAPLPFLPVRTAIERYLRDLRGLLGTNVDEARRLLRLALDKIVLVCEGPILVAEITGNFAGVLTLENGMFGSVGAGRGI